MTKIKTRLQRGLTLLLAVLMCLSLLQGAVVSAEAATPSKKISTTIKFYNRTGKRIAEFYFEDSKASDYGEEYLATRKFNYWTNGKYINIPLEFKKSAAIDFYVRYSDGSGYEAKGLKLAKAKTSGNVINLTSSKVTLRVKNKNVAYTKFVQKEQAKPAVTGVTLNKTTAALTVGSTMNLTAAVSPQGAYNKVIWSSSNKSVATVSNGVVKAVKAGTATITVKTIDGDKKATCKVTVEAGAITATISFYNSTGKTITELYFEDSDADDYGEEYLTASKLSSWSNRTSIQVPLTFKSDQCLDFYVRCSDGSEYEAQELSLAKAKQTGTKITFTTSRVSLSVNGSTLTSVTNKTKKTPVPASVKLNKTTMSLTVGNSSTLTATVTPSTANKKVTWASSDTAVATVSTTGKVTAVKPGTAIITAQTVEGGLTAACTVTVTAKKISAKIYFHNNTGKQIEELYFVESGDSSWGNEYLYTNNYSAWLSGKYIVVPLEFTTDASLDFYIRCGDGSAYEARGLSLAKATASGTHIYLTTSSVTMKVNGTTAATVAFVQKDQAADSSSQISDADWTALQSNYSALVKAYNEVAKLYNSDQIKANKDIETAMNEAASLIEQMGKIERASLSAADAQKLNEAMKLTAEALLKIIDAMEVVPATRTINVQFINATTVDFTNFTAKPQGDATGSTPQTLAKDFGKVTLQFTVADTVSAFEITFVESANNQPYTMTVTFDSSVKDGDTLTVQFNVDEATQKIVYSQK